MAYLSPGSLMGTVAVLPGKKVYFLMLVQAEILYREASTWYATTNRVNPTRALYGAMCIPEHRIPDGTDPDELTLLEAARDYVKSQYGLCLMPAWAEPAGTPMAADALPDPDAGERITARYPTRPFLSPDDVEAQG